MHSTLAAINSGGGPRIAQIYTCCGQGYLSKDGFAKHKLERHSQIVSFQQRPVAVNNNSNFSKIIREKINLVPVPSNSMSISVRTIPQLQQQKTLQMAQQSPSMTPAVPSSSFSNFKGMNFPRTINLIPCKGMFSPNASQGASNIREDDGGGDDDNMDYADDDADDFYVNAISQCTAELRDSSNEILKFDDESNQLIKTELNKEGKIVDTKKEVKIIEKKKEEKRFIPEVAADDCTGFGYLIGNNQYRCNSCYKVAYSIPILKLHYESMHRPKNNKRCGLCGINVKHRCNFTRHLRTCHVPNGIPCPFCSCGFFTQLGLNSHVVKVHSVEDQRKYLRVRPLTKSTLRRLSKDDRNMLKFGRQDKVEQEEEEEEEDNLTNGVQNGFVGNGGNVGIGQHTQQLGRIGAEDLQRSQLGNLRSEIIRTVGGKFYECKLCGKLMKSRVNLRQHMLIHSGQKPLACVLCGIMFRFECNRRRHMRTCHVSNGEFRCKICPCAFVSPVGLKVHVSKYHNSSVPPKVILKKPSSVRPMPIKLLQLQRQHISKNQNPQIISYQNSNNEMEEANDGVSEEVYSCAQCGKLLNSKLNLRNHMLIHSGEKPEECKKCGQTFRLHSTLWGHMKVSHVENGAFPCSQCPCVFDTERGVIRHRVIYHNFHSDDYRRRGKRIRPKLIGHLMKGHSKLSVIASPSKSISKVRSKKAMRHKCKICGKVLLGEITLENHMLIHTGEKPETCEYCGISFRLYSTLSSHIKTNHMGIGTEQCIYCSCVLTTKTGLSAHYRKFHEDRVNPLKVVAVEVEEEEDEGETDVPLVDKNPLE